MRSVREYFAAVTTTDLKFTFTSRSRSQLFFLFFRRRKTKDRETKTLRWIRVTLSLVSYEDVAKTKS